MKRRRSLPMANDEEALGQRTLDAQRAQAKGNWKHRRPYTTPLSRQETTLEGGGTVREDTPDT